MNFVLIMEQKSENKSLKTPPKLDLPFGGKRRSEFGEWIYVHRTGVSITVMVYLLAGIVFVTTRIMVDNPIRSTIYMELVNPDKPEEVKAEEPKPEDPKEIEKLMQQQYEKVQNISVNQDAKLDAGLKDDRGTKAADLYKEAAALQDKLNANKQMLEKGLSDEQAIINSRNKPEQKSGQSEKREDQMVKGNVTVSFSLNGRSAVVLPVPAYQCEGGGTVVVEISVNRNGKVTAATVGKATSTSDQCIIDMSLKAARNSRFNVDGSAEEPQRGAITYMFVPQ